MDIEEEEKHRMIRALCCPSARALSITSRDFYNNNPIEAERKLSIPLIQNNELKVKFEGEYVGKIVHEKGTCQFQLFIYDAHNYLQYEVKAEAKQKGLFCFLPFKDCRNIIFDVWDRRIDEEQLQQLGSISQAVGQIVHIFYGWDNELCSKADQYGIKFPDNANVKDKALLIMCSVFIDYLWFENL